MMTPLIHFIFSFLATVTFGILTNIPRRALVAAGFTGAVGWMIYWVLLQLGYGIGTGNFFAAVAIGSFSVFFSRKIKMPMIIFNIPSLVPLVPGGPAYKAIRELILGNMDACLANVMIVVVTAGAIAAGFMITGLLENLVWKIYHMKKRGSA